MHARGRGVLLLLVLGAGTLVVTVLTCLVRLARPRDRPGRSRRTRFRRCTTSASGLLTAPKVGPHHHRGGAITAAIRYTVLQTLDGYYRPQAGRSFRF
jgi:hypothetical protein